MKYELTPQGDCLVRLSVELESAQLEATKRRVARKYSRSVKIPGFRPGKAPYSLIARYVGEDQIRQEALDILAREYLEKALEEEEITPYGQVSLVEVPDDDSSQFVYDVPLEPEVELGDYHSIRIPYEPPTISEERLANALELMRESRAKQKVVERPAQVGDYVTLSLQGRLVNDSEDDGDVEEEEATVFEASRRGVILHDELSWPFPGFSQSIIGLASGDKKEVTYQYPEDAEDEKLRGKTVRFDVEVHQVVERLLPELNDEFAQEVGDFSNMDELKENLLAALKQEVQQEYDDEYDERLFEEVSAISTIKYPRRLVEEEIDALVDELQSRLVSQGMDLALFLKINQLDEDGLRARLEPEAEKLLRRRLILSGVAKQEKISVDESQVGENVTRRLRMLAQSLKPKEAKKVITAELIQNLVRGEAGSALAREAFKRLRAIARGEIEDQADQTLTV